MSSVRDRLSTAIQRRNVLLKSGELDAVRVFNGGPDGMEGVVIEKLGPVLIVQLHEGKFDGEIDALKTAIADVRELCGASSVYLKRFVRDRSAVDDETSADLRDPHPWIGDPAPERLIIREGPLRFIIRPFDGFSVGLFLEQRENRRRVQELAKDRRVLNTFAYTCGFSVASAAGGAKTISSVDLSVRYLEWGKENFTENGLSQEGHWFFRSDVLEFYERAARQNRRYDFVILDPPTFSKSRRPARVFVLKDQLDDLVRGAIALLEPTGLLLLACNDRHLTLRALEACVHHLATPRKVSIIERPPLPPDFANDPDYSKSIIARFD